MRKKIIAIDVENYEKVIFWHFNSGRKREEQEVLCISFRLLIFVLFPFFFEAILMLEIHQFDASDANGAACDIVFVVVVVAQQQERLTNVII